MEPSAENEPRETPSRETEESHAGASRVRRYAQATVPTTYGELRIVTYRDREDADSGPPASEEHVAIVRGEVRGLEDVIVRVHSACFTGEVLHSLKCDCREQLDLAIRSIVEADRGAVLYLRQEGRGIGLGNKIRAYALQEAGADTVEANRLLGFGDDLREYDLAADMLRDLGIRSVRLMTNNPKKCEGLREAGIEVRDRIPMQIEPNDFNRAYLRVKAERMGHLLPHLGEEEVDESE